jgi:hypothetical protein
MPGFQRVAQPRSALRAVPWQMQPLTSHREVSISLRSPPPLRPRLWSSPSSSTRHGKCTGIGQSCSPSLPCPRGKLPLCVSLTEGETVGDFLPRSADRGWYHRLPPLFASSTRHLLRTRPRHGHTNAAVPDWMRRDWSCNHAPRSNAIGLTRLAIQPCVQEHLSQLRCHAGGVQGELPLFGCRIFHPVLRDPCTHQSKQAAATVNSI